MKRTFNRVPTLLLLISSLMLACSLTIPAASSPAPGAEPPYRFDELPNQTNENSAISEYRAISKWDKLEITYFFANGTDKLQGDTERELISQAFNLWAAQTPLTFTETTNSTDADIVVEWAVGDHGDGDPFDGPGDVLAHASCPNPYDNSQ